MDSLNEEQLKVFHEVSNGKNAFITGGVGVGKSFLVKYIRQTHATELLSMTWIYLFRNKTQGIEIQINR